MKIYTKRGDKGKTGLFGGERVDKDDLHIECNGELDEVNSTIGLIKAKLTENHHWQQNLQHIQTVIMKMMSDIANPGEKGNNNENNNREIIEFIEQWIEEINQKLGNKMNALILPGGNEVSASCHIVRTQIRRAERKIISLNKQTPLPENLLVFVNRLSDLFFMLALEEMHNNNLLEKKFK